MVAFKRLICLSWSAYYEPSSSSLSDSPVVPIQLVEGGGGTLFCFFAGSGLLILIVAASLHDEEEVDLRCAAAAFFV